MVVIDNVQKFRLEECFRLKLLAEAHWKRQFFSQQYLFYAHYQYHVRTMGVYVFATDEQSICLCAYFVTKKWLYLKKFWQKLSKIFIKQAVSIFRLLHLWSMAIYYLQVFPPMDLFCHVLVDDGWCPLLPKDSPKKIEERFDSIGQVKLRSQSQAPIKLVWFIKCLQSKRQQVFVHKSFAEVVFLHF